uniref:Uncharacterized protein n=1 Tax=Arundo donax TaxID=35708 RepID=A0A0A8Z9T5_ARUDO
MQSLQLERFFIQLLTWTLSNATLKISNQLACICLTNSDFRTIMPVCKRV